MTVVEISYKLYKSSVGCFESFDPKIIHAKRTVAGKHNTWDTKVTTRYC